MGIERYHLGDNNGKKGLQDQIVFCNNLIPLFLLANWQSYVSFECWLHMNEKCQLVQQ